MTFAPGTKAVIKLKKNAGDPDLQRWEGLPVEIVNFDKDNGGIYPMYYVQPLDNRPDGHNLSRFFWDADELEEASSLARDFQDRPIRVGDKVIYPNRTGSSMWLVQGKVVEVGEKVESRWDFRLNTKIDHSYPYIKVYVENGRWSSKPYTRRVYTLDRVAVVN